MPRALPRARRFLGKPLYEKSRSLYARWIRIFPGIPFPVRLPFGAWWLARNDYLGSVLLSDSFENAERSFVEGYVQPGMVVFDIGAHQGFYTLLASKKVGPQGKVFAFEPSPRELKALKFNIRLNLLANVEVEELALGNDQILTELYVVEGKQSGCNSLRSPNLADKVSRVPVQMDRLDDWLEKTKISEVDFIKLDVEGGELEVLTGAVRLLSRHPRPVILAELQDARTDSWGRRAKETAIFLANMGFRWFRPLDGGRLASLTENLEEYEGNYVAIPIERLERMREIIENGTSSQD